MRVLFGGRFEEGKSPCSDRGGRGGGLVGVLGCACSLA